MNSQLYLYMFIFYMIYVCYIYDLYQFLIVYVHYNITLQDFKALLQLKIFHFFYEIAENIKQRMGKNAFTTMQLDS